MLNWIADGMVPSTLSLQPPSNFVPALEPFIQPGWIPINFFSVLPWTDDWKHLLTPLSEFKNEMLQILRLVETQSAGDHAYCFESIIREHPASRITDEIFCEILFIIVRPILAKKWFHEFLIAHPTDSAESLADRLVDRLPREDISYRKKLKNIHCINVWRKYSANLVLSPVRTRGSGELAVALPKKGKERFLNDLRHAILGL